MNRLFQVKICGITSPADALIVCEAGADAIGLNFYPQSPRYVDQDVAVQIASQVDIFNSDSNVLKVGVFVNADSDLIVELVQSCKLDAVQLHGDELPEIITNIKASHQNSFDDVAFIRAIRLNQCDDHIKMLTSLESEIDSWAQAGANAILLDAAVPGSYGGTGTQLDWSTIPRIRSSLPIILAGGLTPGNVFEAKQISGAKSVDTASGVEASPRNKDPLKVVQFIAQAGRRFNQ